MRRLFPHLSLVLATTLAASSLAASVLLDGCAGSEPDGVSEGISEVAPESLAVVALTWRTTQIGLAQVYVIDHKAGRRPAALELLSMPAAANVLDTTLGVGECRVDRPHGDAGPIVLRDAGEIAVDGDMGVSVLDSSWLPEGSLDISGVAYAGLLSPRAPMTPGAAATRKPIQVMADGSPEVGPFTVQLTPPPAVKLLAVGGHDVAKGRVQLAPGDLTQHLEVTWEPAELVADGGDAAPASSDLTVVVFERRTFGATWTVSCVAAAGTPADDGHFTIPAGALLALPDLGPDRTDSVLVRRISSASFAAAHVPEGMALAVSEDQAYVE